MFGFLTAGTQYLDENALIRYRSCYCGLCRSLGERYGIKGKLTLNYDMTFLVLLLGAVYEPDEETAERTCLVHPFSKRTFLHSAFTDYAADMNVALSYLKLLDNWNDDKSLVCRGGAAVLSSAYNEIKQKHPRQCEAMEASICELCRLENDHCDNPDLVADTFGALFESVITPEDDYWNRYLAPFGRNLGRFIYLMDACVDLEKDVKKGSYNVFSARYGKTDNNEYFAEILKMLLGDVVYYLNMLPVDRDRAIIDNILCIGLWSQFNSIYNKEGQKKDVSGSV